MRPFRFEMLACRHLHRKTYNGGQFELVPLFAVFLIFYSIGMPSVCRRPGDVPCLDE